MRGLCLHTSNRLETLFNDLADVVRDPLPFVLQPEIIVVQSLGMGRWLSLQLATEQGICANVQFPFQQRFLSDLFRAVLPEILEGKHFDRDMMTWRLMHVLPQMVDRPEFEAVSNYLRGERQGLKRFQLASKITDAFNQYIAFRPRMILDWDAGKENHWQAILWRELTRESQGLHQAALGRKLVETLEHGGGGFEKNTSPRSIFCVFALAHNFLGVFKMAPWR